jgi:DNA-binding CsgD family transcriptional regulator/tetratricopeptide (TPR) repeat protein
VLSAPAEQVPATVRDAVLARASRLSASARAVVEVVSLVPDRTELSLLEAVAAADAVALDEAIESGMLVPDAPAVRFRHELARLAVESAVPVGRAAALHGHVLAHLVAAGADPARLAFHAEAAGDADAVLRYAPTAGDRAAAVGAHREAAAHYARAVRHADAAPLDRQAELHERRSQACLRSGDLDAALDAAEQSIKRWHATGDVEREAVMLAHRSNLLWRNGRNVEAHHAAATAVSMVTRPGSAMAQVCGAHARLLMLARDMPRAIALGTTSMEQARQSGDDRTLARALNVVGAAHWFSDPDRAVALLTESLEVAHRAGEPIEVAGAMINLGSGAGEVRRYAIADHWLAETIAWSSARDLDIWRGYALAWRARSEFEQGRWAEATASATEVLTRHALEVPTRIVALTVLGRLRTRRGDPDAQDALAAAWELARRTGDLQRLWPAAAGRAEFAWLAGKPELIEDMVAETVRLGRDRGHEWSTGELGYWRWVAGAEPEPGAAPPFALQMSGDPGAAAEHWRALGCPYEAAMALADGSADEQLVALQALRDLGATPAANLVTRRLREQGVRGIPRGPRRATRANPANLTGREAEVLDLLADGMRNADIAAQLHIAIKTVDHHVSAILGKLGVATRQEAVRAAQHG